MPIDIAGVCVVEALGPARVPPNERVVVVVMPTFSL